MPYSTKTFYCEGLPPNFQLWGSAGVWHWATGNPFVHVERASLDPGWVGALSPGTPVLSWDAPSRRLLVSEYRPNRPLSAMLDFRQPDAIWQIERGWDHLDSGSRPMSGGQAIAWVAGEGDRFTIAFRVPDSPALRRRHRLGVLLDGEWLGSPLIEKPGPVETWWRIRKAGGKPVQVDLRIEPDNWSEGPAELTGLRIDRFGFSADRTVAKLE